MESGDKQDDLLEVLLEVRPPIEVKYEVPVLGKYDDPPLRELRPLSLLL